MVCSASKTKLLILSTKELRESKLLGRTLSINVGDKRVTESSDEKLLGITMSNDLSRNAYLYGTKNELGKTSGLLNQLSKQIGMVKSISRYLNSNLLNSIINGLFTSKLLYCLPLFSNVWGTFDMDDTNRRYSALTKEDMRRLQILQNRVLRIKCQTQHITVKIRISLQGCSAMELAPHGFKKMPRVEHFQEGVKKMGDGTCPCEALIGK